MKQTSGKLFTKIVCMILCLCMLTTSLASCGVWDTVVDFFTPDDPDSDTPGGDIPGGETPGGDTPGGDTPGGDTPGGDTETTYYKVSFAVALEEFKSRVTLPNDKLYEAGTEIQFLPTPVVRDMLFMGWYYDATMTRPVKLTDKVNSDLMLYAKVVDTSGDISTVEGVYYHTVYDAQTDYKFSVKAESIESAETNLSIENISSAGKLLARGDEYTITDNGDGTYSVNVKYKAGKTYRANLVPSSGVCFVVEGTELSEQVTTLNVLTAKAEVSNLTLSDGLIYIPLEDVEMLTDASNGLISVSTDGAVINNSTGFFRYDGAKLKSGDLVAIYEGDIPSERDFGTNNGAVKYLTVTGSESNNVYKFKVSDSKEVLFIPDILPVAGTTNEENSSRIPASLFDVNSDLYKQLGMNEDTKVEVGDYIAFFNGPMTEGTPIEYVRIDSLSRDIDSYYIDYTPVSYDDVMATMDLYHTRTETPELPDEKVEEIKAQVYNDAINSGFIEEAADYLVNLYVSSNGLETMPNGTTVRYYPKMRARARSGGSGLYYEVTKCEAKPDVKVGQGVLKHFEESDGIRVELVLSFEVEFTIGEDGKNKVVIAAEAVFEEEILLSLNVDGGAVWKKAWIFPYIADYEMNANIDIGTYTGVSVIAKVYTNNGEEKEEEDDDDSFFPDFDLDNLGSGDSYDEKAKSIGEELKKLFELNDKINEEVNGEEEEDDKGNDITEKYAEMMKDANEAWIEIVRVEIFKQSQNLDQFGILWFEIGIDFVVSAQLYIMAGIEVETGVAKRYNFSITLFSRKVTTDVIDLEKAHFSFKFYVMGTAGLKVGFEVELSLALLSSDVASVGISAELGVQLGIWGYFYYSYEKVAGQPAETQKAGAMFFELGIYLEVKFKAHLFNIDKLTYNPTLYENMWPIYSVGTQENVFAFEDYTDEELSFKMQSVNKLVLPNYIFRMKYLDLKDGKYYAGKSESDETPSKVFDDATESHFVIEISDKRFSYDPKTNTLTTTVDVGNMEIDDTFSITITLTYRHGALAFNQENITRDITVTVMNDKEYRYISGEVYRYCNANGEWISDGPAEIGSFSLPFKIGSKVTLADIPTPKASDVYPGYRFERWVYANDRGRFFRGIEEMPDEDIQLLAFWTPVEFKYPVEIYLESADGVFIYESTEYIRTLPRKTLNLSYGRPGYYATAEDLTVKEAMPNETHKLYFKRADRTVRFTNLDNEGTEIFIEYKAGSPISPPIVSKEGYNFGGWEVTVPYYDRWKSSIPMPETVPYEYVQKLDGYHYSYSAIWTPRDDIPYTVKHYVRNADDLGYSLYMTEYFTGTYGEELKDRDFYSRDVVIDGYSTVYNGNKTVVELDGSSVIRLYYERLEFGVYANVDIEGESGCWVGSKIPHGATVNLDKFWPPQLTGYRFVGWDLDGDGIKDEGTFIMPKEDVDVYTLWELSDDISYEVNHYVEETWGYDFVEREYRYGTHLSTPNVEDLFLETLLSDSEILPNYEKTKSVQILAGKRNEIDVYYDRVKYNANIEVIDPNTKEVIKTVVVPLPYNALLADYLFPDLSEFDIVEGYTVSSYDYNGYYYMPKKEITIKVNYKPQDNIPFIVNHYIEKLDGSYELFTSTSHTERAGTRVSYQSWKYDYPEGFPTNTHTLNSDKIETTYVSGRGDTALNLYYDRAKVYYEGTLWKLDASGNKSIWAYHTIESRVGDYVVLNGYYPNYEFASFTNKTDDWTITAPECGFTAYANESGTNKFKFEMHVKPKEGVPYTVNYYYETIDGSGYELDPERTVYGTGAFDQYIVSRNYEKYTPGFQVNSKLTSDIKLGEDENVLEIYYSRNTYKVNFMNSDKIDCSVTVELKYGQTINDPGLDTSIPGYVFLGWGDWKEGDTVPAYDLYYLASYTPAKDTPYVVNHYTMGLDGKYTLALTENLSGLTKSTITTEAHLSSEFNGKGFSPRDSYECIILPDGSTVMDIYYVRDSFSYTYHFYFNGKIFETHGRLYAFGAALTENLNAYVEEHREYGIKGYSILEDGEYVSITAEELPTTMPSADTEIRVELEGIGPDVTIVHKIMNLDGETYSEVTTSFKVPPFEELDLQDYILESAKSGFAHRFPVNNQVPSALTENVYEIYYDRLTYTVVYINAHEYETVSESYLYGATLGAAPVFKRAGYTHSGWTAELPETMPAGNVSFIAAWTVLDPVSVTVVHMMESLDGDGYVEKYRETVLATPELALSGKSYVRDIVGGTFKSADREVVANDGSTEICIYYSRNEYIIRFIFGDVPGAGEDVVLKLPYESAITPPDFKVAGYEISGWSPELPETMPAEERTYVAKWQVASAEVTVNHYVESLDGTDRVITETETVSAETGASLNGAAYQKTYEGFTYADADKNVTVMADGSTVINVYYTRNSYNVIFTYGDKIGESVEHTVKYGAAIPTAPTFTVLGYIFAGWDNKLASTMPASNLTYAAQWTADTNVKFTVLHYYQNANDDGYTEVATEVKYGTTGEMVDGANYKKTLANAIYEKAESKTVNADGSTVIKVYYVRTTHKITFTYGDKTGEGVEYTLRYGQNVAYNPSFSVTGYVFAGWDKQIPAVMPDSDVVINAIWNAADGILYKVEHYLQNANDDDYTLDHTDNRSGVTGTVIDGTTLATMVGNGIVLKSAESKAIAANGSTVIKIYYDRASYTVTYTYGDKTGEAVEHTVRYGATLPEAPVFTVVGYTFAGWDSELASTMPATDLTYDATWTANTDTEFTVEHYYHNANDDGYVKVETETKYGTTGATVNGADYQKALANAIFERAESKTVNADGSTVIKVYYVRTSYTLTFTYGDKAGENAEYTLRYGQSVSYNPSFSVVGYVFAGWDAEIPATMPAKNVTINATWSAGNVQFTVEHYYQNANDDGYEKVETETKYGTTGATVNGADYKKTLAEAIFERAESKTVNADGSTVIKVYYVRTSYTLTFTYGDKAGENAEYTLRYGQNVSYNPSFSIVGYVFAGWDKELPATMPAENVTINATWTAGDGVKYLVEHYVQNADDDEYTLDHADSRTGTTGTVIDGATLATMVGNGIVLKSAESKAIAADGTTVIKIYYDRASYTVTYTYGDKTGEAVKHTVRYGATLPEAPVFTVVGYTFAGWDSELASTMPATDLTYDATWTANTDTEFTVEHYYQNANDDGYEKVETETKYGTTGATVNGADHKKALAEAIFERAESKTVNADGSTVIKVYYVRTSYTVTYTYGDKVGESIAHTVRYGATLPTAPVFTVVGYTFAGWDSELASAMPASDLTYAAKWAASTNTKFTVEHYYQNANDNGYVKVAEDTNYGTTDATVNGEAYKKALTEAVYESAENAVIAADGSTVIKVYYTRTTYTLTFTYGDKTGESVAYTLRYGQNVTYNPSFSVQGYVFADWDKQIPATMPAENVTLNATWTAGSGVAYSVEHYHQNANNDEYTLIATDNRTGVTGTVIDGTTIATKIENGIVLKSAESKDIAADGSTVIKIYYDRVNYTVTYTYGDKVGEAVEHTVRYGATLPAAPVFSVVGYTFAGWDSELAATMPATNLTYEATWTANTDTEFTVEHYYQNAGDDEYTMVESETKYGTTDSTVNGADYKKALNEAIFERAESATVAAEGTTVIKVYYTRTTYTLTFTYGDKNGEAVAHTVRYGATLPTAPTFAVVGYTFAGWDSELASTMPATNLTYDATWTANTDTEFTVEHYYQNANDDGYEKVETETKYGTTGATVNGAVHKKALAEAIFERAESKTVNADGSTVIKVYYVRTSYTLTFTYGDKAGENAEYTLRYGQSISYNPSFSVVGYVFAGWDSEIPATMPAKNVTINATWSAGNVQFTVEHYYQNANDDGYTKVESEVKYGTTGATANGADYKKALAHAIFERAESATVAAEGSTVIKVYYTRTTYTLTFTYGDKVGEAVEHTVRYGATLPKAPVFTVVGYTFAGWDSELASTMPATDLTYDATWTANTDTEFTVEHYYQNANDDDYVKVETETKYGTTGATVNGADYEKSLAEAIFEKAESKTVNADGSTVIKVYYVRTSYTLTFTYGDKVGENAEYTLRYGQNVRYNPSFSVVGYVFAGWDAEIPATMPAKNVTINATWSAGNVQFTVEHYYQNANDDGYKKVETETKYGTTGATVNGADYKKELAESIFEKAESKTVNADGTTVIKLYYVRTSYTLTFTYGDKAGENAEYTLRYGQNISYNPSFSVVGYVFAGWDAEIPATMPAENVTINATWTSGNVQYTVLHYVQNADDDEYTLDHADSRTGATGTVINGATLATLIGNGIVLNSAESKAIAADGSTVIKIYYNRISYTLTYTYGSLNGTPVVITLRYGAIVPETPKLEAVGYTFAGWDNDVVGFMPASDLTYSAVWTANTDTEFTVEHYYQNANDDGYTVVNSEVMQGTTGATVNGADLKQGLEEAIFEKAERAVIAPDGSTVVRIYYVRTSYTITFSYGYVLDDAISYTVRYGAALPEAPVFSAQGYTFSGWLDEEELYVDEMAQEMPAHDLVYTALFMANEDTPFTVEHYVEQADGYGYDLIDTAYGEGRTGSIIDDYWHFVIYDDGVMYIFERFNSEELVINPDGSTVLKIYYQRVRYTVSFIVVDEVGNEVDGVDYVTVEFKYGQTITPPEIKVPEGYEFVGFDSLYEEMPEYEVEYYVVWRCMHESNDGDDMCDRCNEPLECTDVDDNGHCDYCRVPMDPENHRYVDNNQDHVCDICSGSFVDLCFDNDRNAICDVCGQFTICPVTGEDHVDEDEMSDHLCDNCEVWMSYMCVLNDGKHECKVCYARFYDMCTDEDGDCWCDVCIDPVPCTDEDDDGFCDVCEKLIPCDKHVDEDQNALCDRCVENLQWCDEYDDMHRDDNTDHLCDHCGLWLSYNCSDWTDDGRCEDCYRPAYCMQELGKNHADGDGDHYCDECGCWMSYVCTDADGDWHCDECGNELQCFDHVDENQDAACDICGEETKCKANPNATYHEDSGCDHICDWCGVWVSIWCIDDDYDGYCDESGCGKEFVCNHVDEDEDNYCDRCYRIINCTHESVSMHICDTCNQKVTDCYSEDGDLFCDECLEEIECHHEGTMDAHVCTQCYEYLSNCYDEDGDGECDLSEYFPHSVQ